ncbi:hypothetical protein ACNHKD_04300 [Methylocystis sp. JAN1]|uniref:hypothetical protein n=1 Tax=Methylocystis sp. JAN1 TaxID=3397211 RepID=UPI003FA2534D
MSDRPLLLLEEGSEQRPARRGFLKNLVMAPVAAFATHKLIVPAQTIVTHDDAAARLKYHMAGMESAFRDLFPGVPVAVKGNVLNGGHKIYAEIFRGEDRDDWTSYACAMVVAGGRANQP